MLSEKFKGSTDACGLGVNGLLHFLYEHASVIDSLLLFDSLNIICVLLTSSSLVRGM